MLHKILMAAYRIVGRIQIALLRAAIKRAPKPKPRADETLRDILERLFDRLPPPWSAEMIDVCYYEADRLNQIEEGMRAGHLQRAFDEVMPRSSG